MRGRTDASCRRVGLEWFPLSALEDINGATAQCGGKFFSVSHQVPVLLYVDAEDTVRCLQERLEEVEACGGRGPSHSVSTIADKCFTIAHSWVSVGQDRKGVSLRGGEMISRFLTCVFGLGLRCSPFLGVSFPPERN
jgi:hypothetical protein